VIFFMTQEYPHALCVIFFMIIIIGGGI
jgi:hypothetical protein